MNREKRNDIFMLLLCLLIGIVLRFYAFDQKSLWVDEVHTFNQSRFGFEDQIRFYADHPTSLYPPLFFLLSHQFYPFAKPERDLRIIPLIFGVLSVPMIYLLAGLFSKSMALPCALSFTFMAYHISLSQEGRSYSMILFLGMAGLYFLINYLKTLEKKYLFTGSILFAVSIYAGYPALLFVVFSQFFWFYRFREEGKRPGLQSFLLFNALILALCLPWFVFLALNYHGQSVMNPFEPRYTLSLWKIAYGLLHDWTPRLPLRMIAVALLVLLPVFSKDRRNAFIFWLILILPVTSVYLFCTSFGITHFVTSRYFINFLPVLLISLYVCLESIERKSRDSRTLHHSKLIFTLLFILTNLLMLPPYYRSGKQDFRGLARYLEDNIRQGDTIILSTVSHFSPLIHYFGVYPESRDYVIPCSRTSEGDFESRFPITIQEKTIDLFYSSKRWLQFDLMEKDPNQNRVWVLVNKITAEKLKGYSRCEFKGYFDASYLNFDRFPADDSIYLFLWNPTSLAATGSRRGP